MTGLPRFPALSSLGALAGRRLPGGCEDCNAEQELSRVGAGLYVLTVHHDDTCPHLNGATA